MSYFGSVFGAVDAESEPFVPEAGADAMLFEPAPAPLFECQQSTINASGSSASPQMQFSVADMKQAYLEALQLYGQQILQQQQAGATFSSANSVPLNGGDVNLAHLLQLQVLMLQQQQQQQQAAAASVPLSFGRQAAASVSASQCVFPPFPTSNQFSAPAPRNVFAAPAPVSDQQAAREARIQKYRAKRLQRKSARPTPASDKMRATALRLRDSNGQFLSREEQLQPKVAFQELENKLAITQSECEKLRQSLSAKESELSNIKCLLEEQIALNGSQLSQLQQLMQAAVISGSTAFPQFEQQRILHDQLQAHQRNLQLQQQQVSLAQAQVQEALGDQMQVDSYASPSVSSPASGIATPITPATPLMAGASTPSALDEDDMDVSGSDDVNVDASAAAKQLLMEKLKKLGGPPSDVYYPYWPGFIMHPAFLQKEDWINMTLRPTGLDPDVLEQERQRYAEAQRRWQQEQAEIAELLAAHPELLQSCAGALNWRTGYWAGNWVPAAEKIDFSKIELRKTSLSQPVAPQLQLALQRRAALEAAAAALAKSQNVSSAVPLRSPSVQSPSSPMTPQTPTFGMMSPVKQRPAPGSPATPPATPPAHNNRSFAASPASLIWREFLRSHGHFESPQQQQASSSSSSSFS